MILYLFILEKEEFLDNLLESMIEAEIEGISIVDAVEAKKILAEDIPIFAGIIHAIEGQRGRHKIILGISDNDNTEDLKRILTDTAPNLLNCGLRLYKFKVEQSI